MNIQPGDIPPATAILFLQLAKEKYMNRFTLVGGTALALQLGHRQSEDLDFIFDAEKIDDIGIRRFIARTFHEYRLIREERGYQLDFLVNNVKLTFFSTGAVIIPFKVKPHTIQYGTINIASVEVIAVLKMATISQRCTIRDYYDIYYISRHVCTLDEIFRLTKSLIPALSPITYTETIIYTKDIPENTIGGHLLPKEQISKQEIATYFIGEIKKMIPAKKG